MACTSHAKMLCYADLNFHVIMPLLLNRDIILSQTNGAYKTTGTYLYFSYHLAWNIVIMTWVVNTYQWIEKQQWKEVQKNSP